MTITVQVIKAATASPLYFDPLILGDKAFSQTFSDFSGNPSWEVWNEISNSAEGEGSSIRFFLSVGTGRNPPRTTGSTKTGAHGRVPLIRSIRQVNKRIEVVKATLSDREREHELLQNLCRVAQESDTRGFDYYRLNPYMDFDQVKYYEWKRATKLKTSRSSGDRMEEYVIEYLADPGVEQVLGRIAYQLVQNRRRRSRTQVWKFFTTGT
jgi:hypothetical protein